MAVTLDSETLDDGVAVVTAHGELTLAEAEDLRVCLQGLEAAGAKHFILDLSGVEFLDSAGLGILVGLYRRVHPEGSVWMAGPPAVVRKTLQITGLARILRPVDTREDALAVIRGGVGR